MILGRRGSRRRSDGPAGRERAGRAPRAGALAGGHGHCADELCRDDLVAQGVCTRRGARSITHWELLATGLANAGSALFGAMPAGGTRRTAVNRLAGAWIQVAALVTAAAALGTTLFLAPFIGLMPHATLPAAVIEYSVGLIKPSGFRAILKIRKTEFVWAPAAMAGVVLLGTLQGIVAAIIVSLVALACQMSDPPVYVWGPKPGTNVMRPKSEEHPHDEFVPGMLVLRPQGRVYVANVQ
ncbi:SulP family inorganic anion transporter [Variovorax brevis]|uniref:SulP family inorganic anion transporter n=1 Tax=Variovorax brevis TaxID=3053503 RepID=UPI00336572B4